MLKILQKSMLDLRSALGRRQCVQRVPVWFPDDPIDETLSTYGRAATEGKTLDQFRTLNPNPVTIGLTAIQLLLENRSRKEFIIVNVGTGALVLGFGFVPTPTNYTVPLQACGTANDGTGGISISDAWKGTVWAVAAASSPGGSQVIVTEIPL